MRTYLLVLTFVVLCSCKEHPNYNPFDDQFNISTTALIKDGCDSISAQCGYFNLMKKEGNLRPYYQIYFEDSDQIVAKGFNYTLDTIDIDIVDFNQRYVELKDSLNNLPLPLDNINSELETYGYQIWKTNPESILATNSMVQDTVKINKSIFEEDGKIFRTIHYFKGNPKTN